MFIIKILTLELGRLLRGSFLQVEAHILLVEHFVLACGPHLGKSAHPVASHNCWGHKLLVEFYGIPFRGGLFARFSWLMCIFVLAIPHNFHRP